MNNASLHDRLRLAAGNRSFRHLAELTGCNHESVRRYMSGQAPSVEFLAALCKALGVSEQWLISGVGPMLSEDIRREALRGSPAPDLLVALAHTVETLIDRVTRLEQFLQTMEARLRVSNSADTATTDARDERSPALVINERVAKLADALPKRPPADVG